MKALAIHVHTKGPDRDQQLRRERRRNETIQNLTRIKEVSNNVQSLEASMGWKGFAQHQRHILKMGKDLKLDALTAKKVAVGKNH